MNVGVLILVERFECFFAFRYRRYVPLEASNSWNLYRFDIATTKKRAIATSVYFACITTITAYCFNSRVSWNFARYSQISEHINPLSLNCRDTVSCPQIFYAHRISTTKEYFRQCRKFLIIKGFSTFLSLWDIQDFKDTYMYSDS